MAGSISNYLELKLLEHSVGKTSFTMPSGCYLALFTATPSDAGGGTEVSTSGTAYARVQTNTSWATAASGAISTNADIEFSEATASWGTITQIGLFDASTSGNLLWWGDLSASKAVGTGDVFKITAGNLTLTLD